MTISANVWTRPRSVTVTPFGAPAETTPQIASTRKKVPTNSAMYAAGPFSIMRRLCRSGGWTRITRPG